MQAWVIGIGATVGWRQHDSDLTHDFVCVLLEVLRTAGSLDIGQEKWFAELDMDMRAAQAE